VATPTEPDWNQVRAAGNLHVTAGAVQAADADDVVATVRFARSHGHSGPHRPEPASGSNGDPSVVGYTLGGGLSWFGRRYGLAANHVRPWMSSAPTASRPG
jgi:hypothetical protein